MDTMTGNTVGDNAADPNYDPTRPDKPVVQPAPELSKVLANPKERMALGTGGPAILSTYLGSVMRTVDPGYDDPNSESNSRAREALQRVRVALTQLHGMGNDRISAQVTEKMKLVPTFGPLQDPVDSVNKLSDLRKWAQENYDVADANMKAANSLPMEVRKDAAKERLAYMRVLDALPQQSSLDMQYKALKERTPGVATTPATVAKDVVNAIPSSIEGVKSLVGIQPNTPAQPGQPATPGATPAQPGAPAAPAAQAPVMAPEQQAPLIAQITKMPEQQLLKLDFQKLPPPVQAAIVARAKEIKLEKTSKKPVVRQQ